MAAIDCLLYGTDEVVYPPLALRAGPLEMTLQGGRLQHIRVGDREVWHGVAFVFRDIDWGTPEPVFERTEVTTDSGGFRVRLHGRFPVQPAIDLRIAIDGSADGQLRFVGEALPSGDIDCNRIGLCVMHAMSAMGARVDIEHTDGRHSRSKFPTLIPPWPPFMLVRGLRHEWANGQWARVDLRGDLFELEDQRNNSDASFKTYSRSNLMPRPCRLPSGEAIRHSAELRLESPQPAWPARRPAAPAIAVAVDVGALSQALPRTGIEIAVRDLDAGTAVVAALRALRPAHLHLPIEDSDIDCIDWGRAAGMLATTHARLRLDLSVADPSRAGVVLGRLRDALAGAALAPESLAIFPSDQRSVAAARAAFPAAAIGGGTPHYFAQLNRLEGLGEVDFITFTSSPLVHGAADDAVMLSLRSLPSMVHTLRARHGALPIRVGPSAIAVRRSPLGRHAVSDGTRRIALAAEDPRSRALFGAAWLLGYAAAFAAAGTQALTLMGLQGSSGLLSLGPGDRVLRHPGYFVLARLGVAARLRALCISDGLRIAALALERAGQRELLIGNLTRDEIPVRVTAWPASAGWLLDASADSGWSPLPDALSGSLLLPPYGIARLDRA